MKCLNCGEEFTELTVTQRYCCKECGREYRRKHKEVELWPSITFECAECGRTVVTEGGSKDKRSRFCSASCERKYWRHPHWERESSNTNFHSADEYASWERRTNE